MLDIILDIASIALSLATIVIIVRLNRKEGQNDIGSTKESE